MKYPALVANPLQSRADVQQAMDDLWSPLRPYFESGGAAPRLGHTQSVCDEPASLLEAFARPLWGIVPLDVGGENFSDWEIYRKGLADGVNPVSSDYWGKTKDFDQCFVEMASIALALALVPEKIWHPLSSESQGHLVVWLSQINQFRCVDNNWLFFHVLTNLALRNIGAAWDEKQMIRNLDRVDDFYRGNGWYRDGNTVQRDYYIPMAMHYYGLIYTQLNPEDTVRCERYRERARLFAPQFANWFAANGAALPIGRSLTYRFAQGAFWGALAFANEEALPWGQIKGLYLRHLRWWFQQPCFSESGLLTIGYTYPNLIMAEAYNAPGSPYWACKSFLPLALPSDHPFWLAKEEILEAPAVSPQPEAGLTVCHDHQRQHLFALSSNQHPPWRPRHGAQKYAKFAYSATFGFSISIGGTQPEYGNGENMLMLTDDGIDWRVRETFAEEKSIGSTLYTRWLPWPDVTVETWLAPALPGHVRAHRIRSERDLKSFEGGFSINRSREILGHNESSGTAALDYRNAHSAVHDLAKTRSGQVIWMEPNTNIQFPLTALPGLLGEHSQGDYWLFTAVVGLPGNNQKKDGETWSASLVLDQSGPYPVIKREEQIILHCHA